LRGSSLIFVAFCVRIALDLDLPRRLCYADCTETKVEMKYTHDPYTNTYTFRYVRIGDLSDGQARK
jgi:hypothetical protein